MGPPPSGSPFRPPPAAAEGAASALPGHHLTVSVFTRVSLEGHPVSHRTRPLSSYRNCFPSFKRRKTPWSKEAICHRDHQAAALEVWSSPLRPEEWAKHSILRLGAGAGAPRGPSCLRPQRQWGLRTGAGGPAVLMRSVSSPGAREGVTLPQLSHTWNCAVPTIIFIYIPLSYQGH